MRQDHLDRALLLRVSEPGDVSMAGAIAAFGAAGVVQRLRASDGLRDPLPEVDDAGSPGRSPAIKSDAWDRWRARLPTARPDEDLAAAQANDARLVVPGDVEWPEPLNDLGVPPVGLWVQGAPALREACVRSVAVVGSRAATAYGIDGAAHRAALASGGLTVAVLANGVDGRYPTGHERLIDRIGTDGLVVTELSPGERPTRGRFLDRNRLIAALTLGTVAVEMALRSGAARTLTDAGDIHRHCMCVPGPVTSPMSAGCHRQVIDGRATLVTSAADVIAVVGPLQPELPLERGSVHSYDTLDEESKRIYDALPSRGGRAVAELPAAASVAPRSLGARLRTLVELGLVDLDGASVRRRG